MKKCPSCGQELPDAASFCVRCGSALSGNKTISCPYCGFDGLPKEAAFCPNCGKEMSLQHSNYAEVHIDTDAPCSLFRFGKFLKELQPGIDNLINLHPGEHKLRFVSKQFDDIYYDDVYSIVPNLFSYSKEVRLKEKIKQRIEKEEEQRRKELEAERKRLEYERQQQEKERLRIAEEAKQRKAEEERRLNEERIKWQEEKDRCRLKELENVELKPYYEIDHDAGNKKPYIRMGYKDALGNVVIDSRCNIWRRAGFFYEGLARVQNHVGKWGFINKLGQQVISCSWRYAANFSDGLARVMNDNGKCGYIDKTGKVVIPCRLEFAGDFYQGFAWALDSCNSGTCLAHLQFIKKEGGDVTSFVYKDENYWTYYMYYDFGRYRAIDFDEGIFHEGLAVVMNEDLKYGYINRLGKLIIPCRWKNAKDFSEGLAGVQKGGWSETWGFIDKTGELVIPFKWGEIKNFSEGLAGVQKGGWSETWGFIDKTGKLVIPYQYSEVSSFVNGQAEVFKADHWWSITGVRFAIDKTGNKLLKLKTVGYAIEESKVRDFIANEEAKKQERIMNNNRG